MNVFQVSLAICLVATLGCSYAQTITADDVLDAFGITPDMTPAEINVQVTEIVEDINDALDEVVDIAANVDSQQLQDTLSEVRYVFETALNEVNDSSRDDIFAIVQVVYAKGKQWLSDQLSEFGFDATDPDYAVLITGLDNVFANIEQQFIEDAKALSDDELREKVIEDLTDLELAVDTLSGYLEVVDIHIIASLIDGVQQKLDTIPAKTNGLNYDQLKARAEPILSFVQSLIHAG